MPRRRSTAPNALVPTLTKALELSVAAPQVVALRTMLMLSPAAAGSASTQREMAKMGAEKLQAWQESVAAMGLQMQRAQQEMAAAWLRQWTAAWTTPWMSPWRLPALPRAADPMALQRAASRIAHGGLAPVHRRATANARRLKRAKR